MAIDKRVLDQVCREHGHDLDSLITGHVRDENNNYMPTYKIVCTKCGGSLEEIGTIES